MQIRLKAGPYLLELGPLLNKCCVWDKNVKHHGPFIIKKQKTLILFNMENYNIIVKKILCFVQLSNKCHPQISATFELCNFPSTNPRGAYIWRGDLTEGFFALPVCIYFWNFAVFE